MSIASVLERDEARRLLKQGELLHVALETRTGPHVTPELFVWNGGRLWFATARRTLKARLLDPGEQVGALIALGSHRLVISGEARPLDPLSPQSMLSSKPETLLAPVAAGAFVLRNAPHLVGFLAEGLHALPHSPATLRMLVAIRPVAVALLDRDEVIDSAGAWHPQELPARQARRSAKVTAGSVPADVADVVEEPTDAVAALTTPYGPAAVPVRWNPVSGTASVPAQLLSLVGVESGTEASIEIDRMEGYLMSGKRGVLLRGDATISRRGRMAKISLKAERATVWRGMDNETVPLDSARKRQ